MEKITDTLADFVLFAFSLTVPLVMLWLFVGLAVTVTCHA